MADTYDSGRPITVEWQGRRILIEHLDVTDPEIIYRAEFFRRAFGYLSWNGIDGDYAEFGSASGKTFRMARYFIKMRKEQRILWSFDSFKGLPPRQAPPDAHPRWVEGLFAMPRELFEKCLAGWGISPAEYRLVAGDYSESIGARAPSRQDLAPNIALAYIDCDMYSSARDVMYFLGERLNHGMVIAFDDYFCFGPTTAAGERLAMVEFLRDNPRWSFVPFQTINWHGQAFIVEDNEKMGQKGVPTSALFIASAA